MSDETPKPIPPQFANRLFAGQWKFGVTIEDYIAELENKYEGAGKLALDRERQLDVARRDLERARAAVKWSAGVVRAVAAWDLFGDHGNLVNAARHAQERIDAFLEPAGPSLPLESPPACPRCSGPIRQEAIDTGCRVITVAGVRAVRCGKHDVVVNIPVAPPTPPTCASCGGDGKFYDATVPSRRRNCPSCRNPSSPRKETA